MQGEILKVYFLKRKREIEERMYLIEMLSSISFSFFFFFFLSVSSLILQVCVSKNSQKEKSNVNSI